MLSAIILAPSGSDSAADRVQERVGDGAFVERTDRRDDDQHKENESKLKTKGE